MKNTYAAINLLAYCPLETLNLIVGPKTAQSVYDWFRTPENIKLLQQLRDSGVDCLQDYITPDEEI